jgi:hypothetical protein
MYRDKPFSALKPGQHIATKDYYKDATTEGPSGKAVLGNFNRFKSTYGNNHDENVQKGSYVVPQKSQNNMSKYFI